MLHDDPQGWDGGRTEVYVGVDIGILIADSLRCTVETNNIVRQLHPNLKKKLLPTGG